MLTVVAIWRVQ